MAESAKCFEKEDQKALAHWAAECAEQVLASFEAKYPDDDRPRQAIEAGRAWARDEMKCGAARAAAVAAHAAAHAAARAPARAAARAAGHAAGTAHTAGHSRHAAACAVAAAIDVAAERTWQESRIPEYLRFVAIVVAASRRRS